MKSRVPTTPHSCPAGLGLRGRTRLRAPAGAAECRLYGRAGTCHDRRRRCGGRRRAADPVWRRYRGAVVDAVHNDTLNDYVAEALRNNPQPATGRRPRCGRRARRSMSGAARCIPASTGRPTSRAARTRRRSLAAPAPDRRPCRSTCSTQLYDATATGVLQTSMSGAACAARSNPTRHSRNTSNTRPRRPTCRLPATSWRRAITEASLRAQIALDREDHRPRKRRAAHPERAVRTRRRLKGRRTAAADDLGPATRAAAAAAQAAGADARRADGADGTVPEPGRRGEAFSLRR